MLERKKKPEHQTIARSAALYNAYEAWTTPEKPGVSLVCNIFRKDTI